MSPGPPCEAGVRVLHVRLGILRSLSAGSPAGLVSHTGVSILVRDEAGKSSRLLPVSQSSQFFESLALTFQVRSPRPREGKDCD